MRQIVACSLLVAIGCSGAGRERRLADSVPEGADVVASVDVTALRGSSALRELLAAPSLSLHTAALDTNLVQCSTRLDDMQQLVLGLHTPTANWMVAIEGPGHGQLQMASCLGRAIERVITQTTSDTGSARHWSLDDARMVVASNGWADAVEETLRGRRAPALTTSVAAASSRANPRLAVWFAVDTRDPKSRVALALPRPSPLDIAGTLHFDENVHVSAYVALESPEAAEQIYRRLMTTTASRTRLDRMATLLVRDVVIRVDAELIGITGHTPPASVVEALLE